MAVNDLLLVNSSFNKDNDSNHQEDEAMIPKWRHSSLPLPIVSVPSTGGSRDFGSVSFFQRKKIGRVVDREKWETSFFLLCVRQLSLTSDNVMVTSRSHVRIRRAPLLTLALELSDSLLFPSHFTFRTLHTLPTVRDIQKMNQFKIKLNSDFLQFFKKI